MSKTPCCPNRAQHGSWVRGSTDLPGPHLHANREKLMSRGLLELVRINVSNIKPCNRQCQHRLIPCIEISFFGQAQRDVSSCGKSRKDFLRPPVRKPTLVWARTAVWAVILAQVVTPLETMESFDSETQLLARNKVVMSFRLRRTARLAFCKPFNNSSNVLNCMRVSTWNIPENREEATSQWFFMDDELTKVPTCPIERDQLRVPRTNHCLISDVGAVAFFDDLVSCALGSAGNSETREQRTRLPAVPAIV